MHCRSGSKKGPLHALSHSIGRQLFRMECSSEDLKALGTFLGQAKFGIYVALPQQSTLTARCTYPCDRDMRYMDGIHGLDPKMSYPDVIHEGDTQMLHIDVIR